MATWVCLVLIQTHQKEQHAAATCFHSSAQLTSYMVWSHVNVCAGPRRGVIIWLGQKITCHPLVIVTGYTCYHLLWHTPSNRIFNQINKKEEEEKMWKEQEVERMRKMTWPSDNKMKTAWRAKTATRLKRGRKVSKHDSDGQMRRKGKIRR